MRFSKVNPKSEDRQTFDEVVRASRAALGDDLAAVVLYGEAASDAYRAGRTPLGIALIVSSVSLELLGRLRPAIAPLLGPRLAEPLVLDEAYVAGSQDAFPLEFLEMYDHHEVLWGKSDVIPKPVCEREHLRREIEEQLKGKLLHLRQGFLAIGDSTDALGDLMQAAVLGFEIVLRGIAHLVNDSAPSDQGALLEAVEASLALELPALKRLRGVRSGDEPLEAHQIDEVFAALESEVAGLADRIDTL